MYFLSQLFVILSDTLFIISMLKRNKKNIVFFLILSTILFGLQYVCLQAWTGAVIEAVELVFLITMYILEIKNKTKYNFYVSMITIIITIVLSILTWSSWMSVLPMLALVIYLTCMQFSNVIIIKLGTFVRLILNGIYMYLLASYFGAALTLVILTFTVVGIVRDYKSKKLKE